MLPVAEVVDFRDVARWIETEGSITGSFSVGEPSVSRFAHFVPRVKIDQEIPQPLVRIQNFLKGEEMFFDLSCERFRERPPQERRGCTLLTRTQDEVKRVLKLSLPHFIHEEAEREAKNMITILEGPVRLRRVPVEVVAITREPFVERWLLSDDPAAFFREQLRRVGVVV